MPKKGYKQTEEHKRKIGKSITGKKNGMYGRKRSERVKEIASKTHKNKKLSEEHIEILRQKAINNNPRYWSGKKNPYITGDLHPCKRPEVRKKISEARIGKYAGENHPNYKGGKSFEPYCLVFSDKGWRQMIYERDHNTCQNCGITKMLSYKVFDVNLHIHHIDYDKKNCGRNNCLLLCLSCNTKANYHRWMWELIYKDKLGVFN